MHSLLWVARPDKGVVLATFATPFEDSGRATRVFVQSRLALPNLELASSYTCHFAVRRYIASAITAPIVDIMIPPVWKPGSVGS